MRAAALAVLVVVCGSATAQRYPIRFAQSPERSTPSEAMQIVHKDLQQFPESERCFYRYFYAHHWDRLQRLRFARVLAGHCNSMSTEAELRAPQPVDKAAVVMRLDLRWYGWDAATWEKLSDPYSVVKVDDNGQGGEIKTWPAGKPWIDGKVYPEPFQYKDKRQLNRLIAPHFAQPPCTQEMVQDVYKWTKSVVPMVRADWFHSQTATQEGKVPGYYDFLGIKDEATFAKLVRFDPKLGDKTQHLRVAVFSGITHQPRRTSRTNSVLGGYRESFDSENAIGLKNPVTVLDDNFRFDITEKYAPLLNGLPAWYLGDNKGGRADKALDNIVGGDLFGIQYAPPGAKVHDTRLHVNISCISCHFSTLTENGVKGTGAAAIKKLSDPNYYVLADLTRKYLRDIAPLDKIDRLGYAAAYKLATGWEPAEFAVEYRTFHGLYEFGKINLRIAAEEMGVSPEKCGVAFAGYEVANGKLNPILQILKDGGEVPRRQFEEVFPEAMRVFYSVKLVPKEGAK